MSRGSRFCGRPTSKRWVLKFVHVTDETRSIWCHVGVLVYFTSILHSHILLGSQVECEANLDMLHLLHQWECLKCNGHRLSISCVKWPLVIRTCKSTQISHIIQKVTLVPMFGVLQHHSRFTTWRTIYFIFEKMRFASQKQNFSIFIFSKKKINKNDLK